MENIIEVYKNIIIKGRKNLITTNEYNQQCDKLDKIVRKQGYKPENIFKIALMKINEILEVTVERNC